VLLQHAGGQRLRVLLELLGPGEGLRVLGDLADVRKVLLHVVLQRLDVVADGLDLALGIFQHVFDIRHMSLFRDCEGYISAGRYALSAIYEPRHPHPEALTGIAAGLIPRLRRSLTVGP